MSSSSPAFQPIPCACRTCGHTVKHLHAHYPFCSQACRMRDPEYGAAKPHGSKRASVRRAKQPAQMPPGKGDSCILVRMPDGHREFFPG